MVESQKFRHHGADPLLRSSRNSEVVHAGRISHQTRATPNIVSHRICAGLYYPPESLKTLLCIRGRQLLYDRCQAHNIPFKKTGKLVVAHAHQRDYIEKLHTKAQRLHASPVTLAAIPTQLIDGEEAREMEPCLSSSITAALWSPETGIVDSHSLVQSLEKDIQDSPEAHLVYSTRVVRVDPEKTGWTVQTLTAGCDQTDSFLAKVLINASGLSANLILNSLLPREKRVPIYFAKGSYTSYRGRNLKGIKRLIYPCPEISSQSAFSFASLGTHLTLDLHGNIKFGPDIEWISPPDPGPAGEVQDYWREHLVPDDSPEKMREIRQAVASYLPGVELDGLSADYVGIRPKLIPPGGGFQDFVLRTDYPMTFLGGDSDSRRAPMITLLGIESPGLTSSLAIAERIVDVLPPGMPSDR